MKLVDAYMIRKGGHWYRSNYAGYCNEVVGAGVYSLDQARDACVGESGVTHHKLTEVLSRANNGTVAALVLAELS
jgi:hypothetical protein